MPGNTSKISQSPGAPATRDSVDTRHWHAPSPSVLPNTPAVPEPPPVTPSGQHPGSSANPGKPPSATDIASESALLLQIKDQQIQDLKKRLAESLANRRAQSPPATANSEKHVAWWTEHRTPIQTPTASTAQPMPKPILKTTPTSSALPPPSALLETRPKQATPKPVPRFTYREPDPSSSDWSSDEERCNEEMVQCFYEFSEPWRKDSRTFSMRKDEKDALDLATRLNPYYTSRYGYCCYFFTDEEGRACVSDITRPLPLGWKKASAPDGRTYYHRAADGGVSQWERPTEPAPPLESDDGCIEVARRFARDGQPYSEIEFERYYRDHGAQWWDAPHAPPGWEYPQRPDTLFLEELSDEEFVDYVELNPFALFSNQSTASVREYTNAQDPGEHYDRAAHFELRRRAAVRQHRMRLRWGTWDPDDNPAINDGFESRRDYEETVADCVKRYGYYSYELKYKDYECDPADQYQGYR